jgi:hypothetical protein
MLTFKKFMMAEANPIAAMPQPGVKATQLDPASMKAITNYLSQIEAAGYRLLVHQTDYETAHKITQGQTFGHMGVHGTALFTNSAKLAAQIQGMNAAHTAGQAGDWDTYRHHAGTNNIHKGSDAIVVMAIPVKSAKGSTMGLDDVLADLFGAGKIKQVGVPNNYIVGYWNTLTGQFAGNARFKPDGTLP